MMNLKGKHITLGVTGSIAAYKSALLARLFIKAGAEVQVVMTPAAQHFIGALTLATLTDRPVLSDFFDHKSGAWNSHVDLGLWSDLLVIAPVTAATLGKMANGVADNLLVTSYLSSRAPVLLAPAMDLDMYAHPSTHLSLERLISWGAHVVEPGVGEMASHLMGKGRMAEPEEIFEAACRILCDVDQSAVHPSVEVATESETLQEANSLVSKHVLITSGPTYEKIDPVRFIGNHSTGKMGKALAEVAAERGAHVLFVTGPVHEVPNHPNIDVVHVVSAEEMYDAAAKAYPEADIALFCAAVADYRVEEPVEYKIKREEMGPMTLSLVPNPDIAAALGAQKGERQFHIGFALETSVSRVGIMDKMERKNLDMIVVNSLSDPGAGFATDTNKVLLLDATGSREESLPLMSKVETAHGIWDYAQQLMKQLGV